MLNIIYDKYLYARYVDFKTAIDSVWHDALFLKLRKAGIGGPFYEVMKNM